MEKTYIRDINSAQPRERANVTCMPLSLQNILNNLDMLQCFKYEIVIVSALLSYNEESHQI